MFMREITMGLKILIAAVALTVAPVAAFAACFDGHSEANISCAEGTQWDVETRTCVPTSTS